MKVDIKEVAAAALSCGEPLLREWLPGGRRDGSEFKVGSVAGERGSSLSINIKTGRWADFAGTMQGGDYVSLYAAIYNLDQLEAAKQVGERLGILRHDFAAPARAAAPPKAEPKPPAWVQIIPAPETEPAKFSHKKLGKPSRHWRYETASGQLIGYVCRFDLPDGSKDVVPYSYGQEAGTSPRWRWKAFDEQRPLYGLPHLAASPGKNVVVVEGEKTRDAAARLLPFPVVSWPGGGKAIHKADWTPLAGAKVILIPDNDAPGFATMAGVWVEKRGEREFKQGIADILRGLGCDVRYATPPRDTPEGWDLADADWTPEQTLNWLRGAICETLPECVHATATAPADEPQPEPEPEPIPEPEPPASIPLEAYAEDPRGEPEPLPVETTAFVLDDAPFRCLGYERDTHHFFVSEKQQIVSLSAGGMTKNNLLTLANGTYWRREFPKSKSPDFDLDGAVDALIRGSYRAGIFNPERIRGRGAWFDNGKIAVHLGNAVSIAGRLHRPSEVKSRFIYEAAPDIYTEIAAPLTNAEANRFQKLLDMMPWDTPMGGKLAAGWCVVSLIGGVLTWRPHLWVVGARGSGKTWVMSNIFRPILGANCLFVQASSTEAGIRQQLGYDSLPVLFDEAEGEDASSQANIQRVLQLIRQSSSDTGGRIAKGTPGGKSLRYMVRSCFALSSINAGLVQQSDKSRVTVLELVPANRRYAFEEISKAQAELINDGYVAGFYARAIKLADVIRENAVTFARAAAMELGEQRAGDQIGALIAGCYSLFSDKRISFDDAAKWIKSQNWSESKQEIGGQDDAKALFAVLMQHRVRVKTPAGDEEMPIGMLVDYVAEPQGPEAKLLPNQANEWLMRHGFRVEDGPGDCKLLLVANNHTGIQRILERTPWPVNWHKILRRLPNTEPRDSTYFGFKSVSTRAVAIML